MEQEGQVPVVGSREGVSVVLVGFDSVARKCVARQVR